MTWVLVVFFLNLNTGRIGVAVQEFPNKIICERAEVRLPPTLQLLGTVCHSPEVI